MGTYTSNLKLYKPSKNEYYNVDKDQNENFDKIDAKIGEVDNGLKTKLDKGGYSGTAKDLKNEIDSKVSKSGDTMSGILTITTDTDRRVMMYRGGDEKGSLCCFTNSVGIFNAKTGKSMRLFDNGDAQIEASNLNTSSKEVVSAINELNSGKENKIDKKTGFNLDKSDSVTSNISNTLATSLAVKTAYDKASQAQSTADGKVSKSGDTMSGHLSFEKIAGSVLTLNPFLNNSSYILFAKNDVRKAFLGFADSTDEHNNKVTLGGYAGSCLEIGSFDDIKIEAKALNTKNKEIISAINEIDAYFKEEIVNVENVAWSTIGKYKLTRSLDPNFAFTYIYSGETIGNRAFQFLRFLTKDLLKQAEIHSFSHDELKTFRFADKNTFEITDKRVEGTEQNIVLKIIQKHI